jgi:pimeloyl-ACP methyl ester carboxylesterase
METKHYILQDGRTLAYMESGDPAGYPVMYAHGGPGSRLEAEWFNDVGIRKGFRIIATDRPGHGESSYLENRVLLDYPSDISELADALNIDKFGVIGWSGGGIHTTICAYAIPDRLLFNFTFAGYTNWGEMPDAAKYLRNSNKLDKLALSASEHHPLMFRFFFEVMNASDKLMPEVTYKAIVKELNDTDKDIASIPAFKNIFIKDQKEAFRQGSKGPTRDAYLHYHDWGIKLEDINFPIHIFHGTEDYLVPVEYSCHIANNVRDCTLHIWEGEGHLAAHDHMDEIFEIAKSEITI